MRPILLCSLITLACVPAPEISAATASEAKAVITTPGDGDHVPERPTIEGHVADPADRVWVIVHPTEVSDYWVQPLTTPRADGTWKVVVYIGRPGSIDVGKRFEVLAVINPKRELKEGDVLRGWPDAEARTPLIEVIRR